MLAVPGTSQVPLNAELATAPQNSFQLHDATAIVETFVGEAVHGDTDSAASARSHGRAQAATGDDARQFIVAAIDDLPSR